MSEQQTESFGAEPSKPYPTWPVRSAASSLRPTWLPVPSRGGGVRPGDAGREAFWAEAADRLDWGQRWDQVLDWSNPPFAKWFVGGTLNAAVN